MTGLVRGAFEYQGQKCSAASRAYMPRSLWDGGVRDELVAVTESLRYGDVSDFANFGGAVIDRRAFTRLQRRARPAARFAADRRSLAGGTGRRQRGLLRRSRPCWSVDDPAHEVFTTEYFGPILAVSRLRRLGLGRRR